MPAVHGGWPGGPSLKQAQHCARRWLVVGGVGKLERPHAASSGCELRNAHNTTDAAACCLLPHNTTATCCPCLSAQVIELGALMHSGRVWQEIHLLRRASHPRIVKLLGVGMEVGAGWRNAPLSRRLLCSAAAVRKGSGPTQGGFMRTHPAWWQSLPACSPPDLPAPRPAAPFWPAAPLTCLPCCPPPTARRTA